MVIDHVYCVSIINFFLSTSIRFLVSDPMLQSILSRIPQSSVSAGDCHVLQFVMSAVCLQELSSSRVQGGIVSDLQY